MMTVTTLAVDYRIVVQTLLAIGLGWFIWRSWKKDPRPNCTLRSVAILVLGDIGRSPRMMYHAESFAKNEFETILIGYKGIVVILMLSIRATNFIAIGSKAIPSLLSMPHVRFLYLSELPAFFSKLPFTLLAPIKVMHQLMTVLVALFVRISNPPEFIMVQVRVFSPPADCKPLDAMLNARTLPAYPPLPLRG
jgi:beta-1,4-mannosyltransferase